MSARHSLWSWCRRRLAWRLCALFLVGALIPVALSDWLVISVMRGIAEKMDAQRRVQAVRIASRQVLDRIKLGEIVLQARANGGADAAGAGLPGFDRLWCSGQEGSSPHAPAGDPGLPQAWHAAAGAAPPAGRTRLALGPGAPARVLLAATSGGGRSCVGALADDYLWEPLRNGADDAAWTVAGPAGRLLARIEGADVEPPGERGAPRQGHAARLFMGGDGASQEWTFTQTTPRARVDWHEQPVVAWLGAVAGATLLIVGLVGQSRIRRALAPLDRLTAGTRRLAKGDATARVDLQRDDELGELAGAFNDMAGKLQEREAQLYFRAVHDDLTELTNRFGLLRSLDQALHGDAAGRELAVLFIDLDFFKDVNDRHGHAAGDEVLRAAAARLCGIAGDEALIARKGGDEFVVVLRANGTRIRACETAARVVASFAEPFELPVGRQVCGASIGIALCPSHGTTTQELLRCADIALYESKRAGRGRFTVFDSTLDAQIRERHDSLAALRRALDRDELVVHFQPRLDARSGLIESAEALVRWNRPGHGLVLPGAFIELAESSGLIGALGGQVLDRALAQFARWRRLGLRLNMVSVNASPRQLEEGDLPQLVRDALARHALEPSCLELEVTESLLCGDVTHVSAQLAELRAMGVTIAMDDFGTGYSSMALLRTLPIDVMKIDRAFVRDLELDPNAVAIARTIVTLGQSLSLRLVAEGIETAGQAELLRAMGCDELQGYFFGRPMPAQEFQALPAFRADLRAIDRG